MNIKIALGVLLVSMSASVFAQPHSNDRGRDGYYGRDRHPPRVERACFLNGKAYPVGSVVKKYRRDRGVQVCERIRGRAMWIDRYHRR